MTKLYQISCLLFLKVWKASDRETKNKRDNHLLVHYQIATMARTAPGQSQEHGAPASCAQGWQSPTCSGQEHQQRLDPKQSSWSDTLIRMLESRAATNPATQQYHVSGFLFFFSPLHLIYEYALVLFCKHIYQKKKSFLIHILLTDIKFSINGCCIIFNQIPKLYCFQYFTVESKVTKK